MDKFDEECGKCGHTGGPGENGHGENHVRYMGGFYEDDIHITHDYYKCVRCDYDWSIFYDGGGSFELEGYYK